MQPRPAYSFETYLYETERWTLHLVRYQKGDAQPPLSKEAHAFILRHARCARCEQPIGDIQDHEACGKRRKPSQVVLASFGREHFNELRELMTKNARRRFVATRNGRLIAAGGNHTPKQLDELFAVQKGRCYYCWRKIVRSGSGLRAHRDHFESVADGGGSAMSNLVFACFHCNSDKGATHGTPYRTNRLAKAAPQTRHRLRLLHAAVDKFHCSCCEPRPAS